MHLDHWNGGAGNLSTARPRRLRGEVERVLGSRRVLRCRQPPKRHAADPLVTTRVRLACPPSWWSQIDRPRVEPDAVVDQVFDLFVSLDASDAQLDFPVVYASGREGWSVRDLAHPRDRGLSSLLDLIVEWVPPAAGDVASPFCMRVATLTYDDYLGYLGIGRVDTGRCSVGDRLLLAQRDGGRSEFRVQRVLGFQGLKRFELAEARAGDIVALCGMDELNVGETITSIASPRILPRSRSTRRP